jgi:uncharacterized protein (TIGR00251 family)
VSGTAAQLAVRVQARAGRDEIVGERARAVVVRVSAPAIEGRANEALCKLIARRAGVARGAVSVIRGERSRDKVVRVEGIDGAELRQALCLPEL